MKKLPISHTELTIESLAFGGAGIGRVEVPSAGTQNNSGGKIAVFVEGTVPGDRVKVRIGGRKRNYLIGYIDEFVERAPSRIPPFCKHFCRGNSLHCGGCSLQFLAYPDQLKIKEQHVRDSIKRIGGFDENLVLPIIGCENPLYYRNKMEFSFSRMGKNSAQNEETYLSLGQHIRRRHHDLAEIDECFLMEPYIGSFVAGARKLFQKMDGENLLPEQIEVKSLVVRNSKQSGEIMVNLIADNAGFNPGASAFMPEYLQRFKDFCRDFFGTNPRPKLASIIFTDITNRKGSAKKIREHLLFGNPTITETLRRPDGTVLKFQISPQSFFQPNTLQAEVLYAEVIKAADLKGGETVFDLYCGAGTIGIFCAGHAKKVIGIEINRDAVANAIQNARDNNIENIEFFCGDTEKELSGKTADRAAAKIEGDPAKPCSASSSLPSPDLIILDPPRNGLEPGALKKVAAFRAPKIVYVSCNPTTQARDLRLLAAHGYQALSVQPVDMFPHTYHIESVAALQLDSPGA